MLIYSGTKGKFDRDIASGEIDRIIETSFQARGISHDNDREALSWTQSLPKMQAVLNDAAFSDDIEVAVEYQIPQTAKRVDFLIGGLDSAGRENVVVVELKQWTEARKTYRPGVVTAFTGGMERAVAHPSYQAYSYAKTIENFNATVQDENIGFEPCAYLHNYMRSRLAELNDDIYRDVIELSPFYIRDEEKKLRDFIRKYVIRAPKRKLLYTIDNGRIKPSKALQDALGSMMAGNEEFVMIDEQKVVYESVLRLVKLALDRDERYTIIIEGGPGTGKSVVAIQLLCELVSKQHYNAQYVTKNAAPRNVYFAELRKDNYKLGYIKNLFKGSGCFYETPADTFDCLIVDESHRLNEKSGLMSNRGFNQIKEIIEASKVSVFFIDEDQVVTSKDIGSVEEIKRWAKAAGRRIFSGEDYHLTSQFRCNGSDGYIAFIDDMLGIRHTANYNGFDGEYLLKVYDDPVQMREDLRELNKINNKARMVAGYCYEWLSKNSNDLGVYDIELSGGFKARWNFSSTDTWAIDPDSFDQVGCIHTSQGLEFDYVGVIIGKDLLYNGQVVTEYRNRARSDKSLFGLMRGQNPALTDRIIRNTYKTLLTRGQKGCFIYCEDPELRKYLKERVEAANKAANETATAQF